VATFRQLQDMTTAIAGVPAEDYRDQAGRLLNERYQALSALLPLRIKTATVTITANLTGTYSLADDFLVDDVGEIRNVYYTTTSDGQATLLSPVGDSVIIRLQTLASAPVTSWFSAPDGRT
jgi:hypothetical protein